MDNYSALLPQVEKIAHTAGDALLTLYEPGSRPSDRAEMFAAMQRNEQAVSGLAGELTSLRPQARWLPDDLEASALPDGEWWVVDTVEGNVNHVHGTADWCVSITLVADGAPVLTVVRQPVGDNTYTATVGGGAHRGTASLHVADKRNLTDAIAMTGQAEHGQTDTHRAIARSVGAMLGDSLLVRVGVPSTLLLLALASGHADVFWQYHPTLPGVAAGMLLTTEAGGTVTRIDGAPWTAGSPDILVSNAVLAPQATGTLTRI
ncbi:inositol monophosphatase family protein [Rhodococcus sp. G-MC3]|uniref:inositol monophosphatase family protein n=1 Tax=Rhodococcus sp. G-MC3 TaxID=3046209 RepID=UPI0024B9FD08|nr:inositol monophosphatase family protein [Rhodococcus sp. G-MC3]MDJ0392434.1 inositol monophosphatase family protein [Rhodococcus sp. G-MC3]